MSRFLQASAQNQAKKAAVAGYDATAAAAAATPQAVAAVRRPVLLQGDAATTAREQLKHQRKLLSQAEADMEKFKHSLVNLGAEYVAAHHNRRMGQAVREYIRGEDSSRLNLILHAKSKVIRDVRNKISNIEISLGERSHPSDLVVVWERSHITGQMRKVRMFKEDADKHAFWEGLHQQDQAYNQLMRHDESFREQVNDMKESVAEQLSQEQQQVALKERATYIIERKMVGMLASLHGVRCYHIDKTGAEPRYDHCDCIKVAPGEFKIQRVAGSYFLDDAMVKRQIALMEARAAGDSNPALPNPGGWGQPVEAAAHMAMVHMEQRRMPAPGGPRIAPPEHHMAARFQVHQRVRCLGPSDGVSRIGTVLLVEYDLQRAGGWKYCVRFNKKDNPHMTTADIQKDAHLPQASLQEL